MLDINECLFRGLGGHNCNLNAMCVNENGSFACQCLPGFSGNGTDCNGTHSARIMQRLTLLINILDVDECAQAIVCHTHAFCNNTVGSYNCACQPGFEGNGTRCDGNTPTLDKI